MKIDLHHHLLHNRRNAAKAKPVWWEKLAYDAFTFVMNRPALYRVAGRAGYWAQKLHPLVKRTPLDPAAGLDADPRNAEDRGGDVQGFLARPPGRIYPAMSDRQKDFSAHP